MTTPLYLNDTYLFESQAHITHLGTDEKGPYVLLDSTVFYPQGGGQPSDQGFIRLNSEDIAVHFVRQVDQESRHYVQQTKDTWLNQPVTLTLDRERRLLNAQYHTAAHLLGHVVEQMYPALVAVKGHSFPNEAYVEFTGKDATEITRIQQNITQAIADNLDTTTFYSTPADFEQKFYKLPYPVPAHKAFRALQIGDYSPTPCGGTHVSNTSEIPGITIRKISAKADKIKISYGVGVG